MPADLHLTLVLPGLLWPHQEAMVPKLPLPALNTLRQWSKYFPQTISRSLLYRQYLWQGSWLQQAGQQINSDSNGYGFIATPISQTAGMHQLQYLDGKVLGLTTEEAKAFCDVLNAWLQADGWQFRPVKPDLWLVTTPQTIEFTLPSLLDLSGRIDGTTKPAGADATLILQQQTELQMLLYQHPLNLQRNARGLPAINGFWFEQDSAGTANNKTLLYTNSSWAFHAHNLPENYTGLADSLSSQQEVVLFNEELCLPVNQGDVYTYTQILQQWEQDWWQPLLTALQNRQIHRLDIRCEAGVLKIRKPWLPPFWRKTKPFSGLSL
ncbi:hypothetical protein [Snodgrassella gandavensis]|uniref:hypothetical protein n=1 Tax=Snodgrassella gandavensis TaxID=2946698 RepID=UPI001EF529EC|nr:hypothetical protein [Snodgrassella gandavensis]